MRTSENAQSEIWERRSGPLIENFYTLNCPCSIALLADFHNSDPKPVLASLQRRKPDIITAAGDFVYGDNLRKDGLFIRRNPDAIKLLRGCVKIAPTFVSLGNHEFMFCKRDLKAVTETGVVLLNNSWAVHRGMMIGGLNSANYDLYQTFRSKQPGKGLYPKPDKHVLSRNLPPTLDWLDAFEQHEGFKLLLCHHPEYYPLYLRERKIDLIFSGHCHGGQWRFYSPFHGETIGVYAPGQGLFPKLISGIHDGKLVISRGLSNTVWIPRINNPTEIVYINPR